MALTPASGVLPWAARPLNSTSSHSSPLWPMATRFSGRLADDGAVGLESAQDEGLGAQALHLLVDDRRQGDAAGGEPARIADLDEGAGHGRQGAFHVHGAAAEHAAVPIAAEKKVHRRPGVGRHRIEVAAEEEMRPGLLARDRGQDVRTALADLDELGRHTALPEIGREGEGGGLLLPRHTRVARGLDHLHQEFEDAAVVHVRPSGRFFADTIIKSGAPFK